MSTVSRTFTVDAVPDRVVPYLADFTNATEWDPGTQECLRQDSGPVQVGSVWKNTSKIAGISSDLTYTLEELSENRVVLVGVNDTATSTETIDIVASGTGSQVSYTNTIVFNGAAKLVDPLAKLVFEKVGNDTVKQLSGCLNRLV